MDRGALHQPRSYRQIEAFDLARALAAVAVLASHARGLVMADVANQPSLSLAGSLFFGLTALGHQAVIVFLVLSGALITRSMLTMHDAGRWSGAAFAISRLTRFWLVLMPCLLIGAVEDRLGLALTAGAADGPYGLSGSASGEVLSQLGLVTFAGNLAFLQGFAVTAFGSNVPLWTLAIEAWCYAAAFALFSAARHPSAPVWLPVAGAGCILACVLWPAFAALLPVWAVGAALAFRPPLRSSAGPATRSHPGLARLHQAGALALCLAAVVASRACATRHQIAADYGLALAVALSFAIAADWRPADGKRVRAMRFAAGMSFTLYLAHVPLLAMANAIVLHHRQMAFSGAALAICLGMMAAAIAQAAGLWWVCERHHRLVLHALLSRLVHRRAAQGLAHPQAAQ